MKDEAEHEKRAEGGEVLHTKMDMDHPDDKKGGSVRRPRRARGGKSSPVHLYNAEGSPEADEIKDEKEDFKRGGRKHRRDGGHAEGEAAMHRADKAPRAKRMHHAAGGRAGGSPYSSGSKLEMKQGDEASRGHEGVKVPAEPD